jgi:hypothetical protein
MRMFDPAQGARHRSLLPMEGLRWSLKRGLGSHSHCVGQIRRELRSATSWLLVQGVESHRSIP